MMRKVHKYIPYKLGTYLLLPVYEVDIVCYASISFIC